MNTQIIEVEAGKATTTSRQVAEVFGKQHKHVMRDIKEQIEKIGGPDLGRDFFKDETYVVRGREYPMYRMSKDGFTLLVMSYTDETSMKFKMQYIKAFNDMEKQLNANNELPMDPMQQIALIAKGTTQLDSRVTQLEGNQPLNSARYEYVGRRVNDKVREYIQLHNLNYKNVVGELRKDLNHQIKMVTGVRIRRDLRDKHFEQVMDLIDHWTPSTATVMQLRQTQLEV